MKSEKFYGKLKTIRLDSELSLFCMPDAGTWNWRMKREKDSDGTEA